MVYAWLCVPSCMMDSDGVLYVDASRSTFNDIGPDQIVNYYAYFICGPQPTPGPRLLSSFHEACNAADNLPQSTPVPETFSQPNEVVSTYHPSEAVYLVDITTDLINNIVQLLTNDRESTDIYQDLRLELELLHSALFWTGTAIQVFEHTPLHQSLANIINAEVGHCFAVLQEAFEKINRYKQGLLPTLIK
jgi:hypothetical protein